ncbi:hypothetical protein [Deinococcus sp. QL22]|uniref:hypothetical protein n=1 Tax=Deinococcus sp. QL22 TaxID=2939437 RepID=UPI0020183E28|nr:hypothetical protein [Deinococcus sp. QL22]UQN08083.1 hypothetical protein M1R55_18515 [Deinococcus sp. QL22]
MSAPQWIACVFLTDPAMLSLEMAVVFIRAYSRKEALRVIDDQLQTSGKLIGFEGNIKTYEVPRLEPCREGQEKMMEQMYLETLQQSIGNRGIVVKPQ